MPSARKVEKVIPEEIQERPNEEFEQEEDMPKIEFNKRELKSQKEQSINELNETIMAAPEEAAKLITSFIKD